MSLNDSISDWKLSITINRWYQNGKGCKDVAKQMRIQNYFDKTGENV